MSSCRYDYGYKKSWITSRMLCTFGEVSKPSLISYNLSQIYQNQDACQGDSGGPLIWENKNDKRYELVLTLLIIPGETSDPFIRLAQFLGGLDVQSWSTLESMLRLPIISGGMLRHFAADNYNYVIVCCCSWILRKTRTSVYCGGQ